MSSAYTATGNGRSSLPSASVVKGMSTIPNITTRFSPSSWPSIADSEVTP